jgi:uncharacterized membrane protein YdjX (TVP38/TMEM64 family)
VLLPVPSSAVVVAHGALFGVVGGTLLSLLGGLGATLVGFWIGRRSGRLVDLLVPPDQRGRAQRWLARYGPMAIVATRPVPMLAETTAIIAGTSPMRSRWAVTAGAAGNLVPALLYALTGVMTRQPVRYHDQLARGPGGALGLGQRRACEQHRSSSARPGLASC